jgi:O-acetyl-ADP-ribose deacetylase (regulator of RNase III)
MNTKLILTDFDEALILAWQQAFAGVENVHIHHGSIFEVEADALVSPANSFGFMDGGLDMQISKFFGWHVQERLQSLIQTKHHGELLVGMAEIVATGHSQIPYLISAPTMRVPMILGRETVNVYLATRAVLLLIKFGQFEDGQMLNKTVKSVAFSGMGTGVGRVPPEICALQMRQAVEDMNGNFFPRSWWEAQGRHQLLYSDSYRDLQR